MLVPVLTYIIAAINKHPFPQQPLFILSLKVAQDKNHHVTAKPQRNSSVNSSPLKISETFQLSL